MQLIVEAVNYCRHAREMNMPSAGYTKALREAIHFLWERRIGARPGSISGPKICAAMLCSKEAKGLTFGKRELIYDHAIPFNLLKDKLLDLKEVTPRSVKGVLNGLCVTALIRDYQAKLLRDKGFEKRMPKGCNEIDPLARYNAVGIEMDNNEFYSDCAAPRRRGKR